jgi:heme A synthase
MNRNLLKIVNVLLFLAFLVVAFTGLLQYLLPRYFYFGPIHQPFGLAFFILILIHVFLNRAWIKANYLKRHSKS